ncbi:Crp/Fnr family transcriptional regulator [Streptomyces hainanensis]|uniref:Crp/Fnr family transcriptional regulator n=1 Tax=Streptomyces hainanensis TaxID=402648 RepID=A0A4R4SXX5_9ACTN|nr:Crp/Fnr family transcriptional regulator [Streptomyces hainanensis]TDC69170.1 Crp/Fnr family transcriptional regulator [Streptomyces hainanensis]
MSQSAANTPGLPGTGRLDDEVPYLTRLRPVDRATLLALGGEARYAAREPVIRQHEPSTHVALVLTGRLKVTAHSRQAVEALLALRGPGDLIGERSALQATPRSATVTALVPSGLVLVTAERFVAYLDEHPHATRQLTTLMSDRLRAGDQRRLEYGTGQVRVRLAKLLLQLADSFGEEGADGITVGVPLTHDEIAATVSSSRESVTKALAELRGRNVLRTERRRLVLLRPEVLRRMAAVG